MFKRILLELKMLYRISSVYPRKFSTCKIESILPAKVEALIGKGVIIGRNTELAEGIIFVGNHVYIGWSSSITQTESIGHFTCISNGVKIGLTDHALDHISTHPLFYRKRRGWVKEDSFDEGGTNKTIIGADVLISANVLIMKGVKIGHGAVIAAGAVVTSDVEPYSIVGGVPAKKIRKRFSDDLIDSMLKSEWWNLPDETIKRYSHLFSTPEEFLKSIHTKHE